MGSAPGRVDGMDEELRSALLDRLDGLRWVIAARRCLAEIGAVVVNANSDDEAISGIADLMGCSREAATRIYARPLRLFRAGPVDIVAEEVRELERELELPNTPR
jgi:hypothetical protein